VNSIRLYRCSGKEKESRFLVFQSSTKREIRHFYVFRAVKAKKCTKKRDACTKLLFCLSKPIAFLPFSLTLASTLRKVPIIVADCTLSSVSIEPWVSRGGENRGRIETPTPRLETEPNSFAPAHCKKKVILNLKRNILDKKITNLLTD